MRGRLLICINCACWFALSLVAVSRGGETEDKFLAELALSWMRNESKLPPFRAVLEAVTTNRLPAGKVEETEEATTESGDLVVITRPRRQTLQYRVICHYPKRRISLITSGDDQFSDILFDGKECWTHGRTRRGNLVVIRRADQVGGVFSINPFSLQGSSFEKDLPLILAETRDLSTSVSLIEGKDDERVTLVFTAKLEESKIEYFVEFPSRTRLQPSRLWVNMDDQTISLRVFGYEKTSDAAAELCTSQVWYSRAPAPLTMKVADETPDTKLWNSTYTTKLLELEFVDSNEVEHNLSPELFHRDVKQLDLRKEPATGK